MKKRFLYIIPLVLLLLAGCEKRIEFDYEDVQPKVVVQSHNTPGKNVSITLTESKPIFGYHSTTDDDTFNAIDNAQVVLVVGGNSYPAAQDGGEYSFNYQPLEGDVMQLKVNAPGHDEVSASTIVPRKANVGTVKVEQKEDLTMISIPITDAAEEDNYYGIRIREISYYTSSYDSVEHIDTMDVVFKCEDPLFIEHDLSTVFMDDPSNIPAFFGDDFMFDDTRINGLSYTMVLTVNRNLTNRVFSNGSRVEYELIVSTYSRDEYMYKKSFSALDDFEEVVSFFSEPRQIHSNINGGCGLFGARVDTVFNVFD